MVWENPAIAWAGHRKISNYKVHVKLVVIIFGCSGEYPPYQSDFVFSAVGFADEFRF
jgi:hypothetical protein